MDTKRCALAEKQMLQKINDGSPALFLSIDEPRCVVSEDLKGKVGIAAVELLSAQKTII